LTLAKCAALGKFTFVIFAVLDVALSARDRYIARV